MIIINEEIDKYLYSLAILIFFLLFRTIFRKTIIKLLEKITSKTKNNIDVKVVDLIKAPIDFLFFVIGLKVSTDYLNITSDIQLYIDNFIQSLFSFIIFWSVYRLIEPISEIFITTREKFQGKELGRDLINLILKGVKVVIFALGCISILNEWGYNITGFLASLGLVGMAVALAAKDTVANLFGSLVIFSDKPFKIGDWVKTSSVEGIVEEVGIRSTKIRTFAQALVSVPNASLANEPILNWSKMGKRRIKMTIGLTYSTTSVQMNAVLKEIREYLSNSEDIDQNQIMIHFTEFQDSSLGIFCYFFTKTIVWAEFLQIKEKINLKIMEIVEKNGCSFAFPSQSIYIENQNEIN